MTKLVEITPLSPFVGSYPCSLAEADTIDEVLVEEGDVVIKKKVPRKRYAGFISIQRAALMIEIEQFKAGTLPKNIEVITEDGSMVIEHPLQPTVMVPEDIAESLIGRGLAKATREYR